MKVAFAEVIGDPIAHSKSPLIHGFWLERLGIDAEYRAFHVRPEELPAYFTERSGDPHWRGCNVTIPHKQSVPAFMETLDNKARRVGAVNTVYRDDTGNLRGTNTDVDGVGEAIDASSFIGGKAVVIGAGGAARAAFVQLADMNLDEVCVLARSPDKAAGAVGECGLRAEIQPLAQAPEALDNACLLINATQLGMQGQEAMPANVLDAVQGMQAEGLVFDMVYAPLETELLPAARGRGLRTSDGLVMLVGQAATAFAKFFGQEAPRFHDEDLRARLLA